MTALPAASAVRLSADRLLVHQVLDERREMARGTVVSSSGSGPADPRHEQATSRQVPIRERKNPISLRTIIWHSALEFLLTFVLLFGVVTIVRWVIGPSAVVRAVPDIHLQLLIIGTAVGLLITGLILSPPGRASGGRMNPAISLAMRRFGVFPAIGLLPYTAAQLSGSVLGALATGAVWWVITWRGGWMACRAAGARRKHTSRRCSPS
jgi:Major intrinsic protein